MEELILMYVDIFFGKKPIYLSILIKTVICMIGKSRKIYRYKTVSQFTI